MRRSQPCCMTSLMIMCANAQQHGFQYWAFKFRSYVLSVSDLLYQAVPAAKLLFLYRNALTWAGSFSRAFGSTGCRAGGSDGAIRVSVCDPQHRRPSADTAPPDRAGWSIWRTCGCRRCKTAVALQQQGAPLACARFEDLQVAPQAVIQALLAHCGLPMPDPARLARVLATDSQSGTAGAQDREAPVRRLTEAELASWIASSASMTPPWRPTRLCRRPFGPRAICATVDHCQMRTLVTICKRSLPANSASPSLAFTGCSGAAQRSPSTISAGAWAGTAFARHVGVNQTVRSARRPGWIRVAICKPVAMYICSSEVIQIRAIGVHHVDLTIPIEYSGEGNLASIG